jgi:hypothetical protein
MFWTFFLSLPLTFSTTDQTPITLVDPEASVLISTTSFSAPEPPARVRLPEVVAEKGQWRGVQCAVTEPRFAVFRHADKWQAFWEKGLAPFSARLKKTPAIDFTHDMVAGVFLGEKPYPHYEVEIRSIRTEERPGEGQVLVVRFRTIEKMIGVFNPPFVIQPFHLKKVPVFEGPVVFLKVKR